MRKDFYLFRHGETDYNIQGRWQGRSIDAELNATGLAQAENLAEKLKPLGLEVIYSSPLKRALQTARISAKELGIEIRILDELTECCLGKIEGWSKEEISQKYPDLWRRWYEELDASPTRWPGGESKFEIQQRMVTAFNKLLLAPENIIGVASHSGSMRYFLYRFGYGPHRIPNTAIFHLIYEDGEWRLDLS